MERKELHRINELLSPELHFRAARLPHGLHVAKEPLAIEFVATFIELRALTRPRQVLSNKATEATIKMAPAMTRPDRS